MINRPPTMIELKLEEDLVDYEETIEYRKNIPHYENNDMPSYLNQEEVNNYPYDSHQKNDHMNYSHSGAKLRLPNFNTESSNNSRDAYSVSPNPGRLNRNLNNNTRQNIISEFISEEGGDNEEYNEEDAGNNFATPDVSMK